MKPFLSIIIPAYNEEENFKKGRLKQVFSYLKKTTFSYEVILVDDGSSDKTPVLLRRFIENKKNWRLVINQHLGKMAAIGKGVAIAKGKNILFTDFDQATPLSEIEKLLPLLEKNYDIIIGSREVKGARREKEPFYRHLMGKGFNLIVKIFLFLDIQDTQCGFKLFKNEVAKNLFKKLRVSGTDNKKPYTGAFDVELLYLAKKMGFKIAEVPVFWQHFKTKRVNPFRDSLRMFFEVIKIRLYDFLGKYGK